MTQIIQIRDGVVAANVGFTFYGSLCCVRSILVHKSIIYIVLEENVNLTDQIKL